MNEKTSHVVLITGAAGYIGAMLADRYTQRPDVTTIICLDKDPMPELLYGNPKIVWIRAFTCDDDWQETAAEYHPDIVIHAAWQIRTLFGKRAYQEHLNIDGSRKVFRFAFDTPSVQRLVYFSTVASYGAYTSNTFDTVFYEASPFRATNYQYAEEKRITESMLENIYGRETSEHRNLDVAIIRCASITGPRARSLAHKTGLQSVLRGKKGAGFLHSIMSWMTSRFPATPRWVRQFIHEDDIYGITEQLTFGSLKRSYEVIVACPPGEMVTGPVMAELVGKKILPVKPWMVRIIFWFAWWLSLGRIPTSPGGWRSYSYPIVVDGTKVTREYGYIYQSASIPAFATDRGYYGTPDSGSAS